MRDDVILLRDGVVRCNNVVARLRDDDKSERDEIISLRDGVVRCKNVVTRLRDDVCSQGIGEGFSRL